MNLLLLDAQDRSEDGRFRISGRRASHLTTVLRAVPGQSLRVGLRNGPVGTGRVVQIGRGCVTLECVFEPHVPPRALVDLVLAIPRPKTLQKLLPEIAAFGIARLILLRTWRVQKPFLTSHVLRTDRRTELLHDGMMQGRCTREPEVRIEPRFRPFVEDRLPLIAATCRVRLVAHPEASESIANVPIGPHEPVIVALGPEGGFIPYEVDALCAAGFRAVRLCDRPLRVETACVAALAQIELLRKIPRAPCTGVNVE